jgi:uncharacterized protein with PQ loop repeat
MFSDPVSTLGAGATIYSIAAGSALLLQVRTMQRRGSSEDVSIAFLATTCGGYLIWLLYGIGINSMPLIVSDLIGLACSLITVSVALRLRRTGSPDGARPRSARSKAAVQPVASTASAA